MTTKTRQEVRTRESVQHSFEGGSEPVLVVTKISGNCGSDVTLTREECAALVVKLQAFAAGVQS